MNTPAPTVLSQVPLVNSTQLLTQSVQVPVTSVVNPTPIIASTPLISNTPLVVSQVPGSVIAVPQLAGTVVNINTMPTPVAEEEYRLGRSILDDFRPAVNRSQMLPVMPGNYALNQNIPVMNSQVVNPVQLNIKDFL